MVEDNEPEELDDTILPDVLEFSSAISKSGSRFIINVPAGFNGLVKQAETVNVRLEFPYRKLAKIKQNNIQRE